MRFPWPRETVMAILSINNAIDGLSEGGTVNVSAANGVLATDTDPFGAALAVSVVGSRLLPGGQSPSAMRRPSSTPASAT